MDEGHTRETTEVVLLTDTEDAYGGTDVTLVLGDPKATMRYLCSQVDALAASLGGEGGVGVALMKTQVEDGLGPK